MSSLLRTPLEVLCWPTHWHRENGWFYILLQAIYGHLQLSYLVCLLASKVLLYYSIILPSIVFSHFSSVQMVCSDRKKFSCENLCGNLLPCGNHYCTKTCHALMSQFLTSVQNQRGESCEDCHLPCEKVLTLHFFIPSYWCLVDSSIYMHNCLSCLLSSSLMLEKTCYK